MEPSLPGKTARFPINETRRAYINNIGCLKRRHAAFWKGITASLCGKYLYSTACEDCLKIILGGSIISLMVFYLLIV
jgi:hypothetical protein